MSDVKDNRVSVEVIGRYDWVAYYYDPDEKKRYSVLAHKMIADDELCKNGMIYKVKPDGDYHQKILDYRIDQ